jgi:3-phytase
VFRTLLVPLVAIVLAALVWLLRPGETRVSAPMRVALAPTASTQTVSHDADDPAIWIDPASPSRSLLIGTNKVAAPDGAVVAFDLDGRTRQVMRGLDRPNNVDVESGVLLGGELMDVAVATERLAGQLRLWRIDPEARSLVDLGSARVLEGEAGERGMPMGIALYRRASDRRLYAFVAPKTGGPDGYLAQYELEAGAAGVTARLVRRFGAFSGAGFGPEGENEIEAVAVDDALGYVYYADEHYAIRKYHADPDHPEGGRELAAFGTSGFVGQREGIAIYARPDGTGFIVCSDQRAGASEYRVYRREGLAGRPHDHEPAVAVLTGGADATDGLEATTVSLDSRFPLGALVAMNSGGRNFLVYAWPDALR